MRKAFLVVLALAVVLSFACTVLAVTSYTFSYSDPSRLYYAGVLPAGNYKFRWVSGNEVLTFADSVFYDGGDISDYSAVLEVVVDGQVVETLPFSFRFGLLGGVTVISLDGDYFLPDGFYFLDQITPTPSVPSVDLAADISVLSGFFDNFSIGTLLSFIAAGISVSVGLVLLWFALKYIIRKITGALRRGKV